MRSYMNIYFLMISDLYTIQMITNKFLKCQIEESLKV